MPLISPPMTGMSPRAVPTLVACCVAVRAGEGRHRRQSLCQRRQSVSFYSRVFSF
jgi:hypothetical protein